MSSYANASSGMKKMFIAEIAVIVCAVIGIIPLIGVIGTIGTLVCSAVIIYGLYEVSKDIPEVKKAFYCAIANLVVSALASMKITILSSLCSLASTVLALLVLYYLLNPAAAALRSLGHSDVAAYGEKIWQINLICTIVVLVCSVLAYIPLINILAGIAAIIAAIASIVAAIMYIIYLKKASEAFAA